MNTSKNITNTDTKVVPKNERFLGQNLGVRRSLRELPEFSKENSQDKNSSKISGRAFRGSVCCATSIPSLRSGTANAATTIPNAGKKSRNKANYTKLNQYLNKDFDENYALVSHYIQLQGTAEAENYKSILLQNGIDVSSLPTQKDFNKQNDVPFPCKDKTKFTFIDLFAGIGGFRLAMQDIGGKCVFSSEWDDAAKQTYFENYGEVPFGDITKPEIKALIPKEFDVLCAGFPCQPFSSIGKREGFEHKTQGTLFFHIADILNENKPKAFLLENVPGLLTHNKGKTFETIIDVLKNELHYTVFTKVLNSADYEVPQIRKRLYFVGFREDLKISDFNFPISSDKKVGIGTFLETSATGPSISKHLQESYIFKKDDGHPEIIDEHSNFPVKTLCASYHKIQRITGTFVRGGETGLRLLTVNECKAIQGFPKSFKIPVSRTQMYHQFGNSVAVPTIRVISEKIVKILSARKV